MMSTTLHPPMAMSTLASTSSLVCISLSVEHFVLNVIEQSCDTSLDALPTVLLLDVLKKSTDNSKARIAVWASISVIVMPVVRIRVRLATSKCPTIDVFEVDSTLARSGFEMHQHAGMGAELLVAAQTLDALRLVGSSKL
jgi:hypothetical protein